MVCVFGHQVACKYGVRTHKVAAADDDLLPATATFAQVTEKIPTLTRPMDIDYLIEHHRAN